MYVTLAKKMTKRKFESYISKLEEISKFLSKTHKELKKIDEYNSLLYEIRNNIDKVEKMIETERNQFNCEHLETYEDYSVHPHNGDETVTTICRNCKKILKTIEY
jgi:predicted translin family RNA/ssDNA-binding protein